MKRCSKLCTRSIGNGFPSNSNMIPREDLRPIFPAAWDLHRPANGCTTLKRLKFPCQRNGLLPASCLSCEIEYFSVYDIRTYRQGLALFIQPIPAKIAADPAERIVG